MSQKTFQTLVRKAITESYPNPDREGCPTFEALRRLAARDDTAKYTEPAMKHIIRCSPCAKEYLDLKSAAS